MNQVGGQSPLERLGDLRFTVTCTEVKRHRERIHLTDCSWEERREEPAFIGRAGRKALAEVLKGEGGGGGTAKV